MVAIQKVETINDILCHYAGQATYQPVYIELDCENGELSASYNPEIGNTVPILVWYGVRQRFGVKPMSVASVNALMEELIPLADRVVNGYCGQNENTNCAKFSLDADEAIGEIQTRCLDTESDIEVWDAAEWLSPCASNTGTGTKIEDIGTVHEETTDEELACFEALVNELATSEGVVLTGVSSYLEGLRDR